MALPAGTVWLLDYLQDRFYNVRGSSFVIQRAEAAAPGAARKKKHCRTLQPQKGPLSPTETLQMIHRAVRQQPSAVSLLLEGATWELGVDDLQLLDPTEAPTWAATTCTGIVPVPQAEDSVAGASGEQEGQDVYYSPSSSPRRTKMVGFTCMCCQARTYSSVNPVSFHTGTLVAQCAKCERWHKLSDHLQLFHDMAGPIFRGDKGSVTLEDIPPSLRILDPFYWQDEEQLRGQQD